MSTSKDGFVVHKQKSTMIVENGKPMEFKVGDRVLYRTEKPYDGYSRNEAKNRYVPSYFEYLERFVELRPATIEKVVRTGLGIIYSLNCNWHDYIMIGYGHLAYKHLAKASDLRLIKDGKTVSKINKLFNLHIGI